MKNKIFLLCSLMCLNICSCKKLIEVDNPRNLIVAEQVYASDLTASAVLTGIYSDMTKNGIFNGPYSITRFCALSADELVSNTPGGDLLTFVYTNALTNQGGELRFWSDLYAYIFRANAAIEGINASGKLSPPVKAQLLGEAKFIRALMYFYLVNLYGDVPLLTGTNVQANFTIPRTSASSVYSQIIKDLTEAQNEVASNYVGGDAKTTTMFRVRPNKAVVAALLARVYLYQEKWSDAEQQSDKVIADASYQLGTPDQTFLLTSTEAIWQLQPVALNENTYEGDANILFSGGPFDPDGPSYDRNGKSVYLSKFLFNAFSNNDLRKTVWIDSVTVTGVNYPFTYKYKARGQAPRTEYLVMLRLAEQYLIRAEARAKLSKIAGSDGALSDLNRVRQRAGLPDFSSTDPVAVLQEVALQRRLELFMEFGHRWLDLKRTGKVNEVMQDIAPKKGGNWQPYKSLYPIPVDEIRKTPVLQGHQNPGYPES